MRILLQAKKDTHIKDMLNELNFLSVKQEIDLNTLKLLYKIEHSLCPQYLTEKLVRNNQKFSYETRNGNSFTVPPFKKPATQNSLFYKGINMFNEVRKKSSANSNLEKFIQQSISYIKNQ